MKLTKYARQAFIRSVLQAVPQIDYKDQYNKVAKAALDAQLPPLIKQVIAEGLQAHLRHSHWYGKHCMGGVFHYVQEEINFSDDVNKQLESIHKLHHAQEEARDDLHSKIRAAIYSCTTVKQASERMPELIKHLPTEFKETPNVPAPINLMDDLKAAGFKDE